jgi:hypothetical protein
VEGRYAGERATDLHVDLLSPATSNSRNQPGRSCIISVVRQKTMFSFIKKDKERDRFYLLAGMGGRAYRRKQGLILKASIGVGILVAALLAIIIWVTQSSPK